MKCRDFARFCLIRDRRSYGNPLFSDKIGDVVDKILLSHRVKHIVTTNYIIVQDAGFINYFINITGSFVPCIRKLVNKKNWKFQFLFFAHTSSPRTQKLPHYTQFFEKSEREISEKYHDFVTKITKKCPLSDRSKIGCYRQAALASFLHKQLWLHRSNKTLQRNFFSRNTENATRERRRR